MSRRDRTRKLYFVAVHTYGAELCPVLSQTAAVLFEKSSKLYMATFLGCVYIHEIFIDLQSTMHILDCISSDPSPSAG